MATKSYFIGLGGCGLKTVSELQKKLCPNGSQNQDPNGDVYQFTYIDTDEKTYNLINEDGIVIPYRDFIYLGDTNPYQVYTHVKTLSTPMAKRFKEWMIPQGEGGCFVLPNQTLEEGAFAQRMSGRTAIYKYYDRIKYEIKSKIDSFATSNNENNFEDIWVVASSCGGTGSSITLDILYMIANIVNVYDRTPNVKLVLYMPQPFIVRNENNLNYPLNAFSYMWEINSFRLAYQQNKGNLYKYFNVRPEKELYEPRDNFELFSYIIPVDTETSFNTQIDIDDIYKTVAEMMYYLNVGTFADSMVNHNMCCYMHQLIDTIKPSTRSNFEWTRSLVPCGYKVVKKANDALEKYARIRAIYEVLKYGLIGTPIPEEAEEKHRIKREFAKEYVLKFLCDFNGDNADANDSLQSRLIKEYEECRINSNELTTNRVQSFINNVDSIQDTHENDILGNVKKEVLQYIKEQINLGVKELIKDFGLQYTLDLLNIVDDFYLEDVVKDKIAELSKEASEEVVRSKQKCEQLYNLKDPEKKFKDKDVASCKKAMQEYRDWKIKEQLYRISIEIIQELTKLNTGYLEVLRKRTSHSSGLAEVYRIITSYCNIWECKYIDLAKEFRDSKSDVFTINIPDLSEIATGENSTDWKKDNLFDQLYCSTIIDYDRDKAARDTSGKRVPLRKSEAGSNKLQTYIEPIVDSLLEIALSGDIINIENNIEEKIVKKIQTIIENSLKQKPQQEDVPPIERWLNTSLAEMLGSEIIQGGERRDELINRVTNWNSIPVLFPKSAGGASVPVQTNYIYVTATDKLAKDFGYISTDANNQYIEDLSMTDRILIMKMELGLDFPSYKYFDDIQRVYLSKSSKIKKGDWGCHIHKDFALLDIDKALAKKQSKIAYYLFKMVYFQIVIDVIKKHNRDLYNRIFGIIDFNMGLDSVNVQSDSNEWGWDDSNQSGTLLFCFTYDKEEEIEDKFISYKIDLNTQTISFTFKKVEVEDAEIQISLKEYKNITIDNNYSKSIKSFIEKLSEDSDLLSEYLMNIDKVASLLYNKYSSELQNLKGQIDAEVINKGTRECPRLYFIFTKWINQRTKTNEHLFKSAIKALKGNKYEANMDI